jgi:uncharacterized protein (TIGR03435 family)
MRQGVLPSFAAIFVALGVFSASISTAQQPQPAKPLQFEVASIKPGAPPSDPSLGVSRVEGGGPGSQFRMVNIPLKQWVEMGLSVSDYALKAPSWIDTSRFDLDARMPAYKPDDQNARADMMKALLIERFGLKWHEEVQSVSGYELVTDKKVLVTPSSLLERLQGHGSSSGPGLIGGTNISMPELAEALGGVLGRPVVDATHLSGVFDIKVTWRPSDDATAAEQKKYGIDVDNLPSSVSTAVREQLGLRLQSAKVPLKVIVVDNIDRQPTEN